MSEEATPKEWRDDHPLYEFRDWLLYDRQGRERWRVEVTDTAQIQQARSKIIDRNIELITLPQIWMEKVTRFDGILNKSYPTTEQQEHVRSQYAIQFSGTNFGNRKIDFSGLVFPCSVVFANVGFRGNLVNFTGSLFMGNADFTGAQFGQMDTSFNGAKFLGSHTSFKQARFASGNVDFSHAEFASTEIDFSFSNFETSPSFPGAVFPNATVDFSNSDLGSGVALFDKCVCHGSSLNFSAIKKSRGQLVIQPQIHGTIDVNLFEGRLGSSGISIAPYSGAIRRINLNEMESDGHLYVGGEYSEHAEFRIMKIGGRAQFGAARFSAIPDFRETSFDRPIEVSGMIVPKPLMKSSWASPFVGAAEAADAAKLRKLKSMALAAADHEKDGEFFASEMMAKRGTETTDWLGLSANWAYRIFSGYGQSYVLPGGWLIGTIICFAATYALWLDGYVATSEAVYFAWQNSLRNGIPFLGSLFRFAPEPDGYISRYEHIYAAAADSGMSVDALVQAGVLQSLLGGVFFFFLLLGLRNRFRLK